MIRRPPRSTPSNSSAASDVYKRQRRRARFIQTLPPKNRSAVRIGHFLFLIRFFGGRVWIKRALRRGPEPALYASFDVDCRITRRQTRDKLSSTTESRIAGRRTTETIRKNDRDVRGRRRGSPAVVPVVDRQLDRRARPLRSRQGDSDKDGGRRTSAGMDSKSIRACRSTQRPSRRQNGSSPARVRATTGKDESGDRVDQFVLTCCRGAATPSWSWCWRPCRWRPRGPC